MYDGVNRKVREHRDQAAYEHRGQHKFMEMGLNSPHIPTKYDEPIVAAEIHARELFGFSNFSSKSIINYRFRKHRLRMLDSVKSLFPYLYPTLRIAFQVPNN